ncbi:hypothetical protein [Chondrinema litorale]|uniref:hypothetical protein n=1 Tax=Chondrinema litorale TaxID=2994555 RepID=UPI002542E579|nr:hypothetical protein [Chondrinema litorale]UZR94664.1 hypothetical protein OQ292_02380 [Chondrinema litorale]
MTSQESTKKDSKNRINPFEEKLKIMKENLQKLKSRSEELAKKNKKFLQISTANI